MNEKDEMTNINTIKSKLNQNIIKNIVPNYISLIYWNILINCNEKTNECE